MRMGAWQAGAEIELDGVRGGEDGFPVRILCEEDTNRIVVRAVNEGGFACTDIDLLDLLQWLHRLAPESLNADAIGRALRARIAPA